MLRIKSIGFRPIKSTACSDIVAANVVSYGIEHNCEFVLITREIFQPKDNFLRLDRYSRLAKVEAVVINNRLVVSASGKKTMDFRLDARRIVWRKSEFGDNHVLAGIRGMTGRSGLATCFKSAVSGLCACVLIIRELLKSVQASESRRASLIRVRFIF
jgi:hypothetical protein